MVERRHYGQFCGLAAGLDLVGERWTMLILRDLLMGPARFSELLESLAGIGPNLLSARLRALTDSGVVDVRTLAGDGRARQYELTPFGEALRPAILDIARWGLRLLTEEQASTSTVRAAWAHLAVEAMIRGRLLDPTVTEQYEFRVDDAVFHIAVVDGVPSLRPGAAEQPALVMTTDAKTFVRIGAELLQPLAAIVSGRLGVSGDPDAFERCGQLLALDGPAPVRAEPGNPDPAHLAGM